MNMVGVTTIPFPNNEANLETCPFCGHRAVMDKGFAVARISNTDIEYEARWRFKCGNGFCLVHPATEWFESENEARNVWNRRA